MDPTVQLGTKRNIMLTSEQKLRIDTHRKAALGRKAALAPPPDSGSCGIGHVQGAVLTHDQNVRIANNRKTAQDKKAARGKAGGDKRQTLPNSGPRDLGAVRGEVVSQELDLRIGINKTGVQDTKLAPGKARGYKWRARFELFLTNTIADDTNIHYAIAPTRGVGRSNFMRKMSANHSAMLAVTNPDSNYVSYNAHKIIIFTVPSECEVGYVACVEHLKSGTLPRKYQKFQSTGFTAPHVVCLALTRPVSGVLNGDRWNIITDITDSQSLYDFFPPDRFPQVLALADPFGILPPSCGPTNQVSHRCTLDASMQQQTPAFPKGIAHVQHGEQMVLTLCFGDSHATFSLIGGEEVFRIEINETSTFWDVQKAFMIKMHADHRNFKVVLQGGELLNVVCMETPKAIIRRFL